MPGFPFAGFPHAEHGRATADKFQGAPGLDRWLEAVLGWFAAEQPSEPFEHRGGWEAVGRGWGVDELVTVGSIRSEYTLWGIF